MEDSTKMAYHVFVDHGENPCKIPNNDPLLIRLFEVHEDRRYEEAQELMKFRGPK